MKTKVSSKAQREIAWIKTDGYCAYCGKKLNPFSREFVVEHMTPKSLGGTNDPANLTAACRYCNQRKKDRDVDKFRSYIKDCTISKIDCLTRDLQAIDAFSTEDLSSSVEALYELSEVLKDVKIVFYFERQQELSDE